MEPPQDVVPSTDGSVGTPDVGAVFLEHRAVMYRVAHALLRSDQDHRADDVIGEVMLSIVKNPPGPVDNWEAFLVSAVRNKVLDLWKSAPYRREHSILAEFRPAEGDRHGGDEVENDPAPGVVDLIVRQQTVQTVREAMADLEAWDSQAAYVLWQCAGLERSSQQVGDELGVSGSRVRQIAAKAKKKLSSILEAKEVER